MNKKLLGIFLAILSFSCSIYASEATITKSNFSKTKFIRFSDANFCIEINGKMIFSGPKGNIYTWDPSFLNFENQKRAKNFDVNELHKTLYVNAGSLKKGNKVTAALTVIIKRKHKSDSNDATHYYAISRILTKAKKHANEKVPPLFFESGEDNISALFEATILRNRHKLFTANSRLKNIADIIRKIQEIKVNLISEHLRDNQSKDVFEFEHQLDVFDDIIEKKLDSIEPIIIAAGLMSLNDIKLNKVQISESELRKNGGYGPFLDSEQHLLHYLENELLNIEKGLPKASHERGKGRYPELVNEYKENQYDFLDSHYSITYEDTNKAKLDFEQGLMLSENIRINPFSPVGCLLHIFTSQEPCEYCANSILHEFYETEDNNFVKRIISDMLSRESNSPFFITLIIYCKDLTHDIQYILRPHGIISAQNPQLSREPLESETILGLLNIEEIVRQKIVPIIKFEENIQKDQ